MKSETKFLKHWHLLLFTLIILIGLAACNRQGAPVGFTTTGDTPPVLTEVPAPTVSSPPKQLDASGGADAVDPTPMPSSTPAPEQTVAVSSTDTPEVTDPPPGPRVFTPSDRPLGASDPTAFSLASGELQFVEFFAFW